jgi:hypothetical protein
MTVHAIAYPIQKTVRISTITCASCGIIFGIPDWFETDRRRDHRDFYCPSGHCLAFNSPNQAEREAKALRVERDRLERQLANTHESLRSQRAATQVEKRKHAATKGQLTKTRKRAAAALCPVQGCQRHVVQMERHLASKHPDWTPDLTVTP